MKKLLAFSFIGLISILFISGCSFSEIVNKISRQAEGVVLYGNEDSVNNDIDKNSKALKSSDTYAIKLNQNDKNKTMIMNKTTAKDLMKKGLLRKISDDSKNSDETEPIKSLPEVTKDTPVLFANTDVDKFKVGEKEYDVNYGGNVIIGDGRTYANSFMVVDDSMWDSIGGEKKTIGVLHFDKENNPKDKMGEFTTEESQLTSLDG